MNLKRELQSWANYTKKKAKLHNCLIRRLILQRFETSLSKNRSPIFTSSPSSDFFSLNVSILVTFELSIHQPYKCRAIATLCFLSSMVRWPFPWESDRSSTLTGGSVMCAAYKMKTWATWSRKWSLFCIHPLKTRPEVSSHIYAEVYNPPYEIQELGYGEFEIMVQVHFNHPDMPYIQVPHMLKVTEIN